MNEIFSTESRYYRGATELGFMLSLGALVLLFSVPIVTLGPSMAAGYYVATKRKSGHDQYLVRTFIKSFRENLVHGLILSLILGVMGFLLLINSTLLVDRDGGFFSLVFSLVLLVIAFQWTIMSIFAFPLLARFDQSALQTLRGAFLLGNRHVKTSLLCAIVFLTIGTLGFLTGVVLPFALGIYIYFTAGMFVRVFRVHYPDFDRDISDKHIREAAQADELKGVNHRELN